jgi:hypothetical protein
MEAVSQSGAEFLRVPLIPGEAPAGNWAAHYDVIFKHAAENGVRILPIIQSAGEAPTSPTQVVEGGSQSWGQFVNEAVGRYGYGGSFWAANPGLTPDPVIAWELDNEPNNNGISTHEAALEYGTFVAWAGPAIQAASRATAGRETEVLFGSLFLWGDKNSFENALSYMATAWEIPGVSEATTGVSIHPYEIESGSFSPKTPIQAFEYAVEHFRTGVAKHPGLNQLENGAAKTLWITETGWPAAGEYSVEPSGQATLLRESFNYAQRAAGSLKLQGFTWYNFRDAGGSKWDAACGLISGEGVKRPSWTTFQELAHAPKAPDVKVAYRDMSDANSLSGWQYTSETGWQQLFFWGHEVAPGSQPVILHYNEGTHIFFADAGREDRLTEWSWNKVTGWQQHALETDPVSPNSSPSGVVNNGRPEIYFADGGTNNEVTEIRLNGASWEQVRFYGDSASKNTSPSAVVTSGSVRVFFNDESNGNTMSVWVVTPTTIYSQRFGGDPFSSNSSPSAAWDGENVKAFFVDAADNDSLSAWVWTPSNLYQQNLYQDSAAPNSSPSAIQTPGSTQVFFADASRANIVGVWVWTPTTLYQTYLNGDPVAAGTSPSAVVGEAGQSVIYFSDEVTLGSVAVWEWGSTLVQTRLYGHLVSSGSSPGAS